MLSKSFLSAFLLAVVAAKDLDDCTSFSIDDSDAHFKYYRFYDFRNLTDQSPHFLGPPEEDVLTSVVVKDHTWTKDWRIREQEKEAPTEDAINMRYVSENVAIWRGRGSEGTAISLLTTRENATSQTAAELEFVATNITHGSFSVMARVMGDPGAVAGIFTYANDTQETDIELLTRYPYTYAHFANQPTTDDEDEHIDGASFNETAPDYRDWNIYRFDWLADETVWYINGEEMAKTDVHVPTARSMFILNMWSNGGKFSGDMKQDGDAMMQVQWVEMAFNRFEEESLEEPENGTVCVLDKKSVGSPVPESGAARLVMGVVYSPVALWILMLVFL